MEESGKKKNVMVAIDESECSQYALEWALENLANIIHPKLVVFTVQSISDFTYIYPSTYGAASTDLIKTIQEKQKKFAAALLRRAKETCSKYGVEAETITEAGDPKEAICEAVEKLHIQLLVLGSHGRSALGRAFLGSVSNYCVHHASCPVLVVKQTRQQTSAAPNSRYNLTQPVSTVVGDEAKFFPVFLSSRGCFFKSAEVMRSECRGSYAACKELRK